MILNKRFYLAWMLKKSVWQISAASCFVVSCLYASLVTQIAFGLLLGCRLLMDVWRSIRYTTFNTCNANDQPRDWKEIVNEFSHKTNDLAFYGVSRVYVAQSIRYFLENGNIGQSDNNLCGPISFLNFLIKYNPSLFVKTVCEYAENGCTRAPFYLESSFWDRWANFEVVGHLNQLFRNHYHGIGEALASSFKNTHNLTGYNKSCLLEPFKGSTKPVRIRQWLEQAGYQSSSHLIVKNYNNNGEMPILIRFLCGGVYGSNNHSKEDRQQKHGSDKKGYAYISLDQGAGGTNLHFIFNVGSGHWVFQKNYEEASLSHYLKISL